MAAENTKRILSIASKKANRAKEKLTQKIRHEDGTTDEGFAMFVTNFNKQQAGAKKLQKELVKYITAVKGLSGAAKSLSEVLVEVYEPEWDGSDEFKNYAEQRNLLYDDIVNKLSSDVVTPVNDYLVKFPDMQKKIEKRERKLTDHDMTKREFEKMKTKDAVKSKGQDTKLLHAEEKYTQAKQLYDEITDELYKELPSLYDSRIEFIAKLYDSLSRHDLQFHSQVSQIEEKVLQLLSRLSEEAAMGVHTTKRERDAGPSSFTQPSYQDTTSEGGNGSLAEQSTAEGVASVVSETTLPSSGEHAPTTPVAQSPARSPSLTKLEPSPKPTPSEPTTPTGVQNQSRPPKPTRVSNASLGEQHKEYSPDRNSTEIAAPPNPTPVPVKPNVPEMPPAVAESGEEEAAEPIHTQDKATEIVSSPSDGSGNEVLSVTQAEETAVPEDVTTATSPSVSSPSEPAASAPIESVPTTLPPSAEAAPEDEEDKQTLADSEPTAVLYKVVAAHPYKGEDEDELTFDKGAIIFVIPYEDPDDEEDGWKMGFIPSTKAKGIFPENFTKPLQ